MKNILLLVVLATISFFAFESCLSPRVAPALFEPAQLTWPEVEIDFKRGVAWGVDEGHLDSGKATGILGDGEALGLALIASDRPAVRAIDWTRMNHWANLGIQSQLNVDEIGPGVAASLREQLKNFTTLILKLQER